VAVVSSNDNEAILLAIGKLTGEMNSLNTRIGESNRAMVASFAELFVTYTVNADGTTTKTGVLFDWPELD
jgi:hypothetical protein